MVMAEPKGKNTTAEVGGASIMPADQYLAKLAAEGASASEIERVTAMVQAEKVVGNLMIDTRTGMVVDVQPGRAKRTINRNPFRTQ